MSITVGRECNAVRRTRLGTVGNSICRRRAKFVPRILSPSPTTKASFSKKPELCRRRNIALHESFSGSPENSGKRVTFFALFLRSRETDPSWLLSLSLSFQTFSSCAVSWGIFPPSPFPPITPRGTTGAPGRRRGENLD